MITYRFARDVFWIRCGKKVLHVKRTPPLFSERAGYAVYKPLIFGWRWRVFENNN